MWAVILRQIAEPVGLEGAAAGGGEQSRPLVSVEIQRPLQYRPGGGEEEEGGGKVEEELLSHGGAPRRGILADGQAEGFERRPQRWLQGLDGNLTAVCEITKQQLRFVWLGVYLAQDAADRVVDLQWGGVVFWFAGGRGNLRQGRGGASKNGPIELFLSPEVVRNRTGVGSGQVADVTDRGAAVAVFGEKSRRGLEKT